MTSKLDLKAISTYSNHFSEKICDQFFAQKEKISGAEILNISAIEQVNVFSIRGLYENWRNTAQAFKSPFFDFENEKVKAALADFMNIVSQNIAVKKADFLPILTKATAETLTLALSPNEYYEGVLRDLPDFKCTKENANQIKKYIRINLPLIEKFTKNFDENDSIFTNHALSVMEVLTNEVELDDTNSILAQFSEIIPCEKGQFYKNKTDDTIEPKAETSSFFDEIVQKQNTNTTPETIVEKTVAKIVEIPDAKPIGKIEPTTLNEIYQSDLQTLNDHHSQSETKNLADLHQNAPVQNLSGSISLNQKFVFINKLFNGDSAAFNETLQILENCASTDEAINLLKYKYAPKYNWNLNSDEADELIDILRRKA